MKVIQLAQLMKQVYFRSITLIVIIEVINSQNQ